MKKKRLVEFNKLTRKLQKTKLAKEETLSVRNELKSTADTLIAKARDIHMKYQNWKVLGHALVFK